MKEKLVKKLNEVMGSQASMLYGEEEHIARRNYINGFNDASMVFLNYNKEEPK